MVNDISEIERTHNIISYCSHTNKDVEHDCHHEKKTRHQDVEFPVLFALVVDFFLYEDIHPSLIQIMRWSA